MESPILTPKEAVNAEFGDQADTMWKIAVCESGGRQAYADGSVVIGKVTPDVGLFQISPLAWADTANKLNYDIRNITGNILMAHHILQVQGLKAWNASRPCWSQALDT